MNLRTTLARALATAAIATGVLTSAAGAAHAADGSAYVTIHASGTCDTAAGEWVVDWSIDNATEAEATLGDVVSTPAASPATGVPATLPAGGTGHATQRIPGAGGQTASLGLTATWADGSAYAASWQFRPPAPCDAEVETGPWPIVDESGAQRSTLSFNPAGGYAMACYSGTPENVAIEVRYTTGDTARRIVPQFGCTVAGPWGATGDVVSVRGLVGDFANPWHRVR